MKKRITSGNVIEIIKYFTSKVKSLSVQRAPRQKATTEAVKKNNERMAAAHLSRIINANFGQNDISLALTYAPDKRPTDPAAAEKNLKKFLRKLRSAYKQAGLSLKYIATTEYGKTGKFIHHHLVVNKINHAIINSCWPDGWIHMSVLDNTGNYTRLAKYLTKETCKTFRDAEKSFTHKRWTTSRNLVKPKVDVEEIAAASWREIPKAYKGYQITEVVADVSDFTGYPYQRYTMVKIPVFKNYLESEDFQDEDTKVKTRRPKSKISAANSAQREPHVRSWYEEQSLF